MEADARSAFEQSAARSVTDQEWAAARSKLRQFGTILRDWYCQVHASRQHNVDGYTSETTKNDEACEGQCTRNEN